MPVIHFTTAKGDKHSVEIGTGATVMEAAVRDNIPGITADCGGGCACATCHVHVSPEWIERVGSRDPIEQALVEFADGYNEFSRLSCQIVMSDSLDGIKVTVVDG